MRRVLQFSAACMGLVVVSFFVAASSPALAASFDCAKAKGVVETTICNDPKLSKYDDELNAVYKAALTPLSKEGQEKFRASQRAWLKAVHYVCGHGGNIIAPSLKANNFHVMACLRNEYQSRLEALKPPLRSDDGSIVLTHAERFVGVMWPDQSYVMHEDISLIQIDQPASPAQKNFNAKILSSIGMMSDFVGGDESKPFVENARVSISTEAGLVTPDLVTVRGDYYYYVRDRAHGYGETDCYNYLLIKDRLLTAADLFDPQKPWQDFLYKHAKHNILGGKGADDQADDGADSDTTGLRDEVTLESKWFIKRDGLHLFIGYDFFSRRGDPSGEVVVPWEDLRPFLVAGSPVEFLLTPEK